MADFGLEAQTEIYLGGNRAPEGVARPGALADGRWPVSPREWRQAAEAVLDEGAWGYVEGAAGREATAWANRAAFRRWRIVPRMLNDVSRRDLSVDVFGRPWPAPVYLSPVGVQSIVHPDAELAAARAAKALGLAFALSTVSSKPLEEVAAEAGEAPLWFQLYPARDREVTASLLARAEKASYEALVVTVDTTMLGWRERDLRLGYLPFLTGEGLANYLGDPAFRARLAKPPEEDPKAAVAEFLSVYVNPAFTWDDLAFVRERWRRPLLVKGVLHPDDAERAVALGADGVVVSNHGGRQVDGALAALDALPAVAERVGGRAVVLFDGGIRRGADVLKALALGARAVGVGRPYLYAMAVAGEAGVRRLLRNLLADLDLTLGLAGRARIADVDRSLVVAGGEPAWAGASSGDG
ncbi:MAG: alpha-hydroxy-acid oxidizing protein [Clostridia bacterium]|nr:alpha-hydroxy-acid oxidizing protein [Clostridia bacterium]